MTGVPHDLQATLRDRTRGAVLGPGDPGYDEARCVWNARVDRYPDLVCRCRGAADVIAGVDLAREYDLQLGVRSGGHHVSGRAVPDGGLLLDCRPMGAVRVDPDARTARVGPGATWGDVDQETQAFGLAVPGGQDPNIGVAGLTLGGGVGWLSRKHGLTCDNLLAADVVTANGALVRASEYDNPDLFWALRGGGGNFGVVTSFEFDLHPVGPSVLAGSLIHPGSAFPSVARSYRAAADAPPELRLLFGSMVLPESGAYPESVRGERVTIVLACYAGDPDEGKRVLAPLRNRGEPVMDSIRERPYTAWQRAGDSQGAMRTHLRSNYLDDLTDAAIDTLAACSEAAPSRGATVFVSPRGGAETEPAGDATAYPHREPCHHVLLEARWTDPGADSTHLEWVRECHDALQPYTNGRVSVNFLTADDDGERVRATFGENYDRLLEAKREWDPKNRFSAPGAFEE